MSADLPQRYSHITVLGGGAWGTALAELSARAGAQVTLWARDRTVVEEINTKHSNTAFLPGITLSGRISATHSLEQAAASAGALLFVTPSKTVRPLCIKLTRHLPPGAPVVLCCKGVEAGSGKLLHDVAKEVLPQQPIGALSGPTFAQEAAAGHPSAVTIAFEAEEYAMRLAYSLGSESFRPYISTDLTGVEIGGAVKNIIAIACGMMTGAGFAENTRAALITRGLGEMVTLGTALGATPATIMGLSGVGDLTLTCSSVTSRNMKLGTELGRGQSRAECFDGRPIVVEGEVNAMSVRDLAARVGVEMPICEAVYNILYEGADLADSFAALWARPLRAEAPGAALRIPNPNDWTDVRSFAEKRDPEGSSIG